MTILKKAIKGYPVYMEFEVEGKKETIQHQLVCPICGSVEFILSMDLTMGGCVNEDCPCICFREVRDSVDMEGVGWKI